MRFILGAQKVCGRCAGGVWEVCRRCNANDLIGCGGDHQPMKFTLGAWKVCGKVHRRCMEGAQEVHRRCTEGALPMI